MARIYCIGECGVDFYVDNNGDNAKIIPGGRIANAATILARNGVDVAMLGDAPQDHLGQLVVDYLNDSNVDTSAIDRPTDASTPVTIYSADGSSIRYVRPGENGFDIVWPKIVDSDVVIFGGQHSIDPTIRTQLLQFLTYAATHATMIYLPGFYGEETTRITRVMPAIFENLELANYVITRTADIKAIFNTDVPEICFKNHLSFYVPNYINIDGDTGIVEAYIDGTRTVKQLADSGKSLSINAAVIAQIARNVLQGRQPLS